jgi:hypothetical protein
MLSMASGQGESSEGGYAVRRPSAADAIGGALLRTYAHLATVPDDMRRCLDKLDRRLH